MRETAGRATPVGPGVASEWNLDCVFVFAFAGRELHRNEPWIIFFACFFEGVGVPFLLPDTKVIYMNDALCIITARCFCLTPKA